jgi:8-oxo-dGTP diphosphatase
MNGDPGRMIRAAGGVLWRTLDNGTVEVALVHRPEYDDWSLPKGKLRRSEHPLVSACREVTEETGIHAVAGLRLAIAHYDTAAGPKAVEYWAMQGPDAAFKPTAEVDRMAWLPLADARQQLSYQRDTDALDALEVLENSAVNAGSPVLLVRNGHAVSRACWKGSDRGRPLDAKGHNQAKDLRQVLPAFGPSRLWAVGHTRFVDTLAPLGSALGLPVETEAQLDEVEYANDPHRGLIRILELAGLGSTSVMCIPGAVLQHLLAALADEAGLALPGIPAKKGSVWALFFSTGQLAAADYYAGLSSPHNR